MSAAHESSTPTVDVRRLSPRERSERWRRRLRFREAVSDSLVIVPAFYLVAAVWLGVVMPELDRLRGGDVSLGFEEDAAGSILEAIATGMITFSGLVVSVAVLVIQFGAGQYSPRLIPTFRRDPVVKHAVGLFVAPGLYTLVAVGDIRGTGAPVAPDLTVLAGLVLMGAALFALFRFIERLLDLMRPRRIYTRLASEARAAIDDVYPFTLAQNVERRPLPEGHVTAVVVQPRFDAVLAAVDRARIVRVAAAADALVEVATPVGGYVSAGAPLFIVRGGGRIDEAELLWAAVFADSRTVTQDPGFAIRAIVDVAIRALSPAVNDPTTAVEALDSLDALLLRLSHRRLEGSAIVDDGDTVRLLLPTPGWHELLDLALTEIRRYGADSAQVVRRMRLLLDGLARYGPEERLPAVAEHLALLEAAAEPHFRAPAERTLVARPDRLGLGGAGPDWV